MPPGTKGGADADAARGQGGGGGGPEIVLIAAVAEENRVIGRDGRLPWHLPEDLRRFKRLTTGHAVLMGRRTFESVARRLGGPLPDRRNVVLTSRGEIRGYPGVETCGSVEEALAALADEEVVFVAGGASVYRELLPCADRLELTLVEGEWEGDVRFPPYEELVGAEFRVVDEEPGEGYRFVTLRRESGRPSGRGRTSAGPRRCSEGPPRRESRREEGSRMFRSDAFAGKTVLVTGASRGIGAATARAFARTGADVMVNFRSQEETARQVCAGLEDAPGRCRPYRCDVRDAAGVRAMVEEAGSAFAPVDVLVNNAGVADPHRLGALDAADWNRVLETNLTGAFHAASAVVPGMRDRGGGVIVNVSSIAAQMGTVDASYAASKAGLVGLTRALARELGPEGIRVNAIAPGPVETDMGDDILAFLEETDFHGHGDLGTFLDRYAATPADVAQGILYLAGADFVTGEVLTLNGGMHLD